MDKVTVDDALISTDVDRLIRTISDRKRIGVHELERLCSMDRRAIEKWVRVLEDEGYIKIEYGLTGTYVVWAGMSGGEVEENNNYVTDYSDVDEALSGLSRREEPGKAAEYSSPPFEEPEEKLRAYLKGKQEPKEEEKLKADILGQMGSEQPPRGAAMEAPAKGPSRGNVAPIRPALFKESAPIEDPPESRDQAAAPEEEDVREAPETIASEEPEPMASDESVTAETLAEPAKESREGIRARESVARLAEQEASQGESATEEAQEPVAPPSYGTNKGMKEMVNAYLQEINKEKSEIEKLKRKKDEVYRTKLLALESKIEADIVSVTERILDKEGRILELKEHILELPDKVEEVSRLHQSLERLQKEGRASLTAAKERADVSLRTLKDAQASLREKVESQRKTVQGERAKIEDLTKLGAALEPKLEKSRETLNEVRTQMEELGSTMRSLLNELEEATEMKVEVFDMTGRLRQSVEQNEGELDSLEDQLEQINRVEQWTREYLDDYEKKMDEIEGYVRNSEDELDKLRESAEAEYIKKYLRELEGMTQHYEQEMGDAVSIERDIDGKIASAKSRLDGLVAESQEMIKKLRKDVKSIPEFGASAMAAKQRSERIRQVVDEKEKERGKLKEDYARARRGRPKGAARKGGRNGKRK